MQQAVSIAQNRGYLIVNDTRVAGVVRMIPRAEYDELLKKKKPQGSKPATGLRQRWTALLPACAEATLMTYSR